MDISHLSSQLASSPKRFPDCCLALSTTLISHLSSLLPKQPNFTLSVGSGPGLLESLIVHCNENVLVEGVEVASTVNRYIDEEHMNVVGGGWGLCPIAQQATAWMFVYPRDPRLVANYIETFGRDSVERIVWLGPRVDWADYEPCFTRSAFSQLSYPDIGLAPYEVAAVATRST